jgi:hypothetical protein
VIVSGILAATVAGPRFGVGAVCGWQRRAGKAGRRAVVHNRVLEVEGALKVQNLEIPTCHLGVHEPPRSKNPGGSPGPCGETLYEQVGLSSVVVCTLL